MSFELFIGLRYLRSKQKHAFVSLITLLSIAGVAVGVMALIVVIAVMTGFENDMKARILGVESHIMVMRYGGPVTDYEEVRRSIEKVRGVEAAAPFIYSQVMLRSSVGTSGAVLRGVDPQVSPSVIRSLSNAARLNTSSGAETPEEGEAPGIILGKELARKLGVIEGDTIYLISFRGIMAPIGHVPATWHFRVVGLFESGMYEYDGTFAYISLTQAQKIMQLGDAVTGIEVHITDIYAADTTAKRILQALSRDFKDQSFWARDWMRTNANLFSALKLEKTVMFIILTLIILVAAFNIASSLIMVVMEKTRDIAILKTMGATDGSIRKIFVLKGLMIGAVGTFLGTACGAVLCALLKKYKFIELPGDVYYITTLPVQMELLDVSLIAVSAMLISFVATLYPAHQAARLNPLDAIRYG